MSLEDAKVVLKAVLYSETADSLIAVYEQKDSLNTNIIQIQQKEIEVLLQKNLNLEDIIKNLNDILDNKNKRISLMNKTISEQKKEIRKQKTLKIVGFITAAVLPIITAIAMFFGLK